VFLHDFSASPHEARLLMMKVLLARLLVEESGQDLIEYALLTTFVALAAAVGLSLIRPAINGTYGSWNAAMNILWEPPDPE
jgi:Flp pilus assembly pilin Flp